MDDIAPRRPTNVRHVVVLLTTLSAVLLYLDRFCISFASGFISEDLNLSNAQMSYVLSAFFWTYALAQVPTGFLTDAFGARITLTLYIMFWSLFTGLTALSTGLIILLLFRFGFGIAQAGAYPTSASLVSKWATYQARGIASSLIGMGGRVGGFIAPLLTAFLIVFFVPTSTDSNLSAEDFLDFRLFCREVVHGRQNDANKKLSNIDKIRQEAATQVGKTILADMPSYERGIIDANAGLVESVNSSKPATELNRADIAEYLNKHLDDATWFDWDNAKKLALEREAKDLMEKAPSALTEDEARRLNRLILEAAYPDAIKKVYIAGWRPTMLVYGIGGMFVAGAFWLLVYNRPEVHPRCNKQEVDLIENSRPVGVMSPHGKATKVPLMRMMTSTSMWLCCLSQFGTNIGWVFLVTWLPRYLDEVHRLDIELRGVMASVPLIAGWAGMLTGGWATDRLTRAVGQRWGRALPLSLSRFLAMGAYFYCLLEPSLMMVTICFCLVSFATDFGNPATWAFNQDVGGRYVASVLGWGNMWGNLGGAVSPILLNYVVSDDYNWNAAFLTCALAFFASGVCALGVNASQPIAPREEE